MRPVRGASSAAARTAANRGRSSRKPVRAKPSAAPHRQPRQRIAPTRRGLWQTLKENLRQRLTPRQPILLLITSLSILVILIVIFAGSYIRSGVQKIDDLVNATSNYAGFGVSNLSIAGENHTSSQVILAVSGFHSGQSIFAPDLNAVRARLLQLPWVQDAQVTRRYPDTIAVTIVEKQPFALWESAKGLFVIDQSGAVITPAQPRDYPKLPVFVGDPPIGGAELVDALAAHRAIIARVRAMQRVSERRWNLILDSGVLVKLPETDWRKQLDALEHLIVDQGVLERDIDEIDLRSPDQFFFRLRGQKASQPRTQESKV